MGHPSHSLGIWSAFPCNLRGLLSRLPNDTKDSNPSHPAALVTSATYIYLGGAAAAPPITHHPSSFRWTFSAILSETQAEDINTLEVVNGPDRTQDVYPVTKSEPRVFPQDHPNPTINSLTTLPNWATICSAPLHVGLLVPACNGLPLLLKRAYPRACNDFFEI
ncbi:hypothetical protein CBS147339_1458 [Penicillium roqueforti]|nr:hypothetical protein DTO012A8_10055 [Penicillium roqueforti]KAI3085208.1 hypothetical protein CBS147339_1458 [Penicillium roqueforti]KAI3108181.1 hypothetical protein CBS147338_43 [Penicillium roqueforti]KAI3153845.1 hypothetical protein CBS147325_937 [Penicillium roqueforti]KAI3175873.1 hypothetical protein DTO046C5_2556 [Penicillium roqueforti]